jgi:hypothetical protein
MFGQNANIQPTHYETLRSPLVKCSPLILITIAIVLVSIGLSLSAPIMDGTELQVTIAQEETEKSGELTEPEDGTLFGGEEAGTYSIGQDRYGLRIQVNMNESPNNGTLYIAWLVDNSTGDDLGVGQLVDDELAVTQQITNSSLYNLIEVTEESPNAINTSRNQSAVIAGAQLED